MEFVKTWQATKGLRKAAEGELMWQREWFEFAATTKCGNLTEEEATFMWTTWKNNPKHPRDMAGPRGYLRLWVKTKDTLTMYEDVCKAQQFRQVEK